MNFISAEQFLKQSNEVQNVFIKWWKENLVDFDLWFKDFGNNEKSFVNGIWKGCIEISKEQKDITRQEGSGRKPLLTEGQLRKFIEDKKGHKIECEYWSFGYTVNLCRDIDDGIGEKIESSLETEEIDLIQAYWQVAVKIALEEISND